VEIAQHLDAFRREGERLAAVAEASDLDMAIPTTPEWCLRDLLRHMGDVHRWARTFVGDGRMLPVGRDELPSIAGPLPDDGDLLEWFHDGHAVLLDALQAARPDLQCWTFLPAPSPLAFWARRQAHEIGVHRADAESPGGPEAITSFDPELAVDGIDELLLGFFGGDGAPDQDERPPTLRVDATDTGTAWFVTLGTRSERIVGDGDQPEADCRVRGDASDLFLLLWNRVTENGLDVTGDRSVMDAWRENAKITWGRPR
jgi:uncharacterized protein (TIGR03083 family)